MEEDNNDEEGMMVKLSKMEKKQDIFKTQEKCFSLPQPDICRGWMKGLKIWTKIWNKVKMTFVFFDYSMEFNQF